MKEYLPIGSVVMLKDGLKPILIAGYKMSSIDKKVIKNDKLIETNRVYDYCGFLYPEGMISLSINCLFDQSDIKEVLFKGYDTDAFHKLSDFINSKEELDVI